MVIWKYCQLSSSLAMFCKVPGKLNNSWFKYVNNKELLVSKVVYLVFLASLKEKNTVSSSFCTNLHSTTISLQK